MRVFIDSKPLGDGNSVRGVGYYTQGLMNSLQKHAPQVTLVETSSEADIVHYPYFDLFFHTLPIKKQKPTVVTIHDVIPLLYPEHFPIGIKGKLALFQQKYALKTVNHIATVSECSKHDISRVLSIPQKEITNTYQSIDEAILPIDKEKIDAIKQKYHLPETFFLYMGDVNFNKNIPKLIEAFGKLAEPSSQLLLVGKAFLNSDITEVKHINQAIAASPNKDKIRMLGFVPDEDLPALLSATTVYIQPSLYEGFGRPVVQAMSFGVPVIAADTPALKEICADAAAFCSPMDSDSIMQVMTTVLLDATLQKTLSEKGLKRAQFFSMPRFANALQNLYDSVLQASKT